MHRIRSLCLLQLGLLALAGLPSPALAAALAPVSRLASVSAAPAEVCHQGPANDLVAASGDLEEQIDSWGVYCEGAPTWIKQSVDAPSLDRTTLRCALSGGAPYSNIHCYRNLPSDPADERFTLAMWFYYSPFTAGLHGEDIVQAIEFSLSKWAGERRYEWALQWRKVGVEAPGWRYWDAHARPDRWVGVRTPIGDPAVLVPAAEIWHAFALEGEIIGGRVHYLWLTLDERRYPIGAVVDPEPIPAGVDRLSVAVQLDGNSQQTPYNLFIDQVRLTSRPLYLAYAPLARAGTR